MSKKETALAVAPSADALQELNNAFPADPGFTRVLLPRLTFKSQDVTEGKGKNMTVVTEAGTFITEHETEEVDEEGKKIWEKEEIGKEIDGIIVFQRKQLRYYDEATESYTSSPIYDSPNEEIPLFHNKSEIKRGTPAELQKDYEYTDKNGKVRSRLEENRILYVILGDDPSGQVYQLNLRGSSMYSFLSFARKQALPIPAVVVTMNSEYMEKGKIEWNKMTFTQKRTLDKKEVDQVLKVIADIKDGIIQEKSFYANGGEVAAKSDEDDDY